jgi:2,3-bisphosphoglycerate-independent phosphoglycerate mutase
VAIENGSLFAGQGWREIIEAIKQRGGALHFLGLLSDGNVHSHISHLIAMLRRADSEGVRRAYVHALLDGRDVPKTSALTYVDALEKALAEIRQRPDRDYRIASGGGRMVITMDRYESDWSMVERGWKVHVRGEGPQFASARAAIEKYRADKPGIIDQDLPPFVVAENGKPLAPIHDGDGVVAFNFRGDRMLEIVRAFESDDFAKFPRGKKPDVAFAGMTLYDGDTHAPRHFLVPPPQISCTISELLADAGVAQLAVSETQKFGHVTYFWNGNRTGAFDDELEKYVEIPSHPPPFDAKPEMRAREISECIVAELAKRDFKLVRLNYANGDMVGHTGNFEATVKSVEAVDAALALLVGPVLDRHGALVVIADHGNADDKAERNKRGEIVRDTQGQMIPKTSHTLNPVPCYILLAPDDRGRFALAGVDHAGLGNIAATIATLLGFAPPAGYLPSLVRRV